MFKKVIFPMLLMCCIVFISSFDVNAASTDYYLDYAEPAYGSNQGYLTILLRKNGAYSVRTFFWSTYGVNGDNAESPTEMIITLASSFVNFNILQYGASGAWYTLHDVTVNGTYLLREQTNKRDFTWSAPTGYEILGWKIKGNGGVHSEIPNSAYDFNVYYSTTGEAKLLMQLVQLMQITDRDYQSVLSNILSTEQSTLQKLNDCYSYISSINSYLHSMNSYMNGFELTLDSIMSDINQLLMEQKKTNTWLEKIFDYLQESQEQQKQEAEKQGSNSTSQGMNAIEDKGAGFTSSLGGLTSSMSYSGTQCAWEFPEVKLPAITGVMDEVVLIKKQPIDFAVWVNAIPSDILIVVQSLCTIGLIVFCFKELYGTIEYVLTLRKGGGSDE